MKINLVDALIDAYNFKLTSKNIYLDSSSDADKDSTNPYLLIKSNDGNNLFYVSNKNYYLKTNDYTAGENGTTGKGVKVDLKDGSILAYKFSIVAGTKATGFFVANSNPTSIHDADKDQSNAYYLYAGTKDKYLYVDKDGNVGIKAKKFTLTATTDSKGTICIDNTDASYPFKIESSEKDGNGNPKNYCRVGWNGVLEANGG
jgi:hypothetical protein